MDTTAAPAPVRLSRADRCDRCLAQALVALRVGERHDLLFCAHHYHEHASVLAAQGARVLIDRRS